MQPTPPVTGGDFDAVLRWIPTATLLYVVWVAARLHKTVQTLTKDVRILRKRSHRMATFLTIIGGQKVLEHPLLTEGDDNDDESEDI